MVGVGVGMAGSSLVPGVDAVVVGEDVWPGAADGSPVAFTAWSVMEGLATTGANPASTCATTIVMPPTRAKAAATILATRSFPMLPFSPFFLIDMALEPENNPPQFQPHR